MGVEQKFCIICKKPLQQAPTGRERLTCSNACRQKWYRKRHHPGQGELEYRKKKRAARTQVRRWEARHGPFDPILRDRLILRLARGWPYQYCRHCHRPFISDTMGYSQKYCSDKCAQDAWRKRQRITAGFGDPFLDPAPDDWETDRRVCLRLERGWPILKCPVCGKWFIYDWGRPPTYCSTRCRQAAWRKRRNVKYKTCPTCKKRFRMRAANHQYCSEKCRNRARTVRLRPTRFPKTRHCENCGQTFKVHKSNHRYCSKQCWEQSNPRDYIKRYPQTRRCLICGKSFEALHGRHRCCSLKCRRHAYRQKYREKPLST